jgi:hypothetical protein
VIKRGDVLRGWLTRPAMLAVWALVFWGTLLALMAGVEALGEGVPSVWGRLWPARGASLWAWLNLVSVVLAGATWGAIAVLVVLSRRSRPEAS